MLNVLLALLLAQEPAPAPKSSDLPTQLTTRGKLLFSDDFTTPVLPPEWKKSKGEWTIIDGALRGRELLEDKHAAVMKHALPSKNVVLQFAFKFEGASQAACSFDGKGHICRVILTAQGFTLRRDVPKGGEEKPAQLGKGVVEFKPGVWQTMLIEILEKDFLAQVNGQVTAFGSHEGVAAEKTSFGFPVSGGGFVIDAVRVWEALPNPDWPANREKLAPPK